MASDWKPIETAPEGKAVLTRINDQHGIRNEAKLVRQGRLWFFPDFTMYVYYAPTEWKEAADA